MRLNLTGMGEGIWRDKYGDLPLALVHHLDLTANPDARTEEYGEYIHCVPYIPGSVFGGPPDEFRFEGYLQALLRTEVRGQQDLFAIADVTFTAEQPRGARVCLGTLGLAPRASLREPELLPSPTWLIDAGDARPGDFPLRISPPTGSLTVRQGFDLVVVADTGGAAVGGIAGSLDGQDISGPLAACLQPIGTISGQVTGVFLRCPGLSGAVVGPGTHTLQVSAALSDGRTLTDTVTWTVRQ